MNKNLIIIKVGGSVLSLKDSSIPKVRRAVVNRLAAEIKQLITTTNCQLILIHGAGSFGHPPARKYDLVNGMRTPEQKYGYCLMEEKNLELHYAVMNALVKNQVPAISLPPHSFTRTSNKSFYGFNLQIIRGFLKQKLVPVLFGDGVYDTRQGCAILSGDTILPYLAKSLHAKQAIFLSDVDGIFNADPKKDPNANLISEVNNGNLQDILKGLTKNNPDDVSGEMEGKVLEIRKNLRGLPVYIINGLKPKTLLKTTAGKTIGTQLLFR